MRGPGAQLRWAASLEFPENKFKILLSPDWMRNKSDEFFFSKVFKCTWKMRNVLKRMKNQFSDFWDLNFLRYGHFCTQYCQFSMNFHDNSKNKNRKTIFYLNQHIAHPSLKREQNGAYISLGISRIFQLKWRQIVLSAWYETSKNSIHSSVRKTRKFKYSSSCKMDVVTWSMENFATQLKMVLPNMGRLFEK